MSSLKLANLKPLTVSHHHHHHPNTEECNCLFCHDQGMSTPTTSSTLVVDDRRFFIPSEMWYEIFKYSDLYTLSVLMQCQKKWKSLYKMRGFKSKIQFLRMMTVELVVNQLNSNIMMSTNKKYSVQQYAISGKCQISLNEQYLSKKHCNYNDLTKVIKKLDTLKDFILKELKIWEEANGKVDCDQIFSVFKLMNDLFKPSNTSSSGKRNEKRLAKDAFARIAIVGDNGMSKTTFFNAFRSQIDNFESEANCLDDTVVMHSNNPKKMGSSTSSYQIWDNYQSIDVATMPPYFLRRINFLILIFDVSDLSSFSKLQTWVNHVVSGNVKIDTMPEFVLVGTKHDLLKPQSVDKYLENRNKYYQPFADSLGIPYIEVDSTNIMHVNSIIHYSLSWTYFVHLLQSLSSTLKQPDAKIYEKTFHPPFNRSFEARKLN